MSEIDEKFIDVDFPKEKKYVFGNLGKPAFSRMEFASYGAVVPVLTEAEMRAAAEKNAAENTWLSNLVTRIYDQKQEGSCVANACCQAHEITQAKQFGRDKVIHLSAISLYKRIGRSAQSGAMVSDGLEEMASRGILPLDNAENRARFGDIVMPNTGFNTKYPPGWEPVAGKIVALEWFIVDTLAELQTAATHQDPIVVGRQGHSICYCDHIWDGSKWLIKYANSWKIDWGEKGFGYDSLRLIRESADWAFALRSVTAG